MSEDVLNQQFKAATERGRTTLEESPKARAISYNAETKRIIIELESGVTAIVPTGLVEILKDASAEQIKDVELAVGGLYVRWKTLDEDLFVPNLLRGIFGTRRWMNELTEHLSNAGRKGGAARSAAKQKSSAENGKKGGRPRRKQIA